MATLIILLLTYGINISEIIADKASFDKINAREEDDRSLQGHVADGFDRVVGCRQLIKKHFRPRHLQISMI